jgi:hypothetical protein
MRAIPLTLAAFRPEVKKKLVHSGLLMPTVQMILRASNNHLGSAAEYLTGKAHPSVFEGSWVDPVKMVKLAHELRADSLPPLVKLEVIDEESPVSGRDYFEPADLSERHADTVSVISRIWRGQQRTRRLVVSAEKSLDLNKKPLTFRWVVLRGDSKRIQIRRRDKAGQVAEITIAYHERRPIASGSAMASNRVDIGVFAFNGTHHSAPGFLTLFSLDSESRTYDEKGRIVEIGHGMGFTELKIPDLGKLLTELAREGFSATALGLTAAHRAELDRVARGAVPLAAGIVQLRQNRQTAEGKRNKAANRVREEDQKLAKLIKDRAKNLEISGAQRAVKGRRPVFKRRARRWRQSARVWHEPSRTSESFSKTSASR